LPLAELPTGTASIPYQVDIASQSASAECRIVVARLNSSGTIQQSFNGATYTGTAATTLSGTASLSGFVSGDLLAVIVENRRTSGGGSRTTTVNTTSASFVDVTAPNVGVAGSLSATASAGTATGVQPDPVSVGVAANLSATATAGDLTGERPPEPPPWQPDPKVFIGGQDVTSLTNGAVTIRRGRDSVYVEPSASYAAVTLVSVSEPVQLRIGRRLTVTLNNTADVGETLFSGRISDVEVQVTPGTFDVAGYRLTAVGPLAGANRRQALAAGRSVELDGKRAFAAIIGALGPTFEEQPLDLAWEDAEGAWEDYTGPVALGQFDEGVYSLAALNPADGGYSALQVAQEAAQSGGGVLYEDRFGRVAYADAARRATTLVAGDFADIPGGVLSVDGMNASSSLSELANRVIVQWDGGVVQADVPESAVEFGVFVRKVDTTLAFEADALVRAEELVQELSQPAFKADKFSLLMNNLTNLLLDRLIQVEPNDAVRFSGLPNALGFGELTAFVEGIEWQIDPYTVRLGLFASDERLSVGGVWFGRVTSTLEWGDVDADLEWQQVGRNL
jgi:hypothetical protein